VYSGLGGLDYTSSRCARVGFREFYSSDTRENFWSVSHGLFAYAVIPANARKAVLIDAAIPIGVAA